MRSVAIKGPNSYNVYEGLVKFDSPCVKESICEKIILTKTLFWVEFFSLID